MIALTSRWSYGHRFLQAVLESSLYPSLEAYVIMGFSLVFPIAKFHIVDTLAVIAARVTHVFNV